MTACSVACYGRHAESLTRLKWGRQPWLPTPGPRAGDHRRPSSSSTGLPPATRAVDGQVRAPTTHEGEQSQPVRQQDSAAIDELGEVADATEKGCQRP